MDQKEYEISSIYVGSPEVCEFEGKKVETAIFKRPAGSPVFLSRTNFDGDKQADLVHHGGADKAVCVYPADHYPYWENALGEKLPQAAFGENLSVKGLTEQDVCIGDIFKLGEALVQVSQPRQPCFKLAKKLNVKDMVLKVRDTGYSGFYFRVLEEGIVVPDSRLRFVSRDAHEITVAYANRLMYHDRNNQPAIRKILEVEALSESWRAAFIKQLGA
ncbi:MULTISPECIES: MOSC domain-containing protein [Bacillus]|uniref:MOSC domain-containing protein n=1 Tax=Bacillus glycinifermentans TaxID=1664069 RepID=A0AAJ3YW14_9BACI|nr:MULTISPECIES: MOSC domain-containing protein [Bacillus]KKB74094.1 cytoplasmic protein [Bacillus sp. TH008]MDU0070434.1 MOSC domain-containing protein [Bacillus sp. IG6]MED8018297.1 MOSC domain-containing protein [Bacillus glycinifermentans]QAT64249.1 MOSC domain-containing protein [Bacillus glycinifermentans]WKB78151.1 MOSC domain-containing protein [Bacillus glycinifermentans]